MCARHSSEDPEVVPHSTLEYLPPTAIQHDFEQGWQGVPRSPLKNTFSHPVSPPLVRGKSETAEDIRPHQAPTEVKRQSRRTWTIMAAVVILIVVAVIGGTVGGALGRRSTQRAHAKYVCPNRDE